MTDVLLINKMSKRCLWPISRQTPNIFGWWFDIKSSVQDRKDKYDSKLYLNLRNVLLVLAPSLFEVAGGAREWCYWTESQPQVLASKELGEQRSYTAYETLIKTCLYFAISYVTSMKIRMKIILRMSPLKIKYILILWPTICHI